MKKEQCQAESVKTSIEFLNSLVELNEECKNHSENELSNLEREYSIKRYQLASFNVIIEVFFGFSQDKWTDSVIKVSTVNRGYFGHF